jgi:hypothetical protein
VSFIFYIETPIFGDNTRTIIRTANQTISNWQCALKSLSFYQAFSIVYLIQAFFLPFAIMLTSSIIIIRGLFKTRRRIEVHENREMKSRKAKDIKFAVSSIFLDFLFIVLTTPVLLTYVITVSDRATSAFFTTSTALLFSINFSKSFFAYIVSNSIFRKELKSIIKSIKSGNVSSTSGTRKTNSRN